MFFLFPIVSLPFARISVAVLLFYDQETDPERSITRSERGKEKGGRGTSCRFGNKSQISDF